MYAHIWISMLYIATQVYLCDRLLFSLVAGKRLITLAWFRRRAIEMPPCSRKASMLMGAVGFWVFCFADFKIFSQLKGSFCLPLI